MRRLFEHTNHRFPLPLWTGLILVLLLLLATGSSQASSHPSQPSPEPAALSSTPADAETIPARVLLRRTLDRIQKAENYEIDVSIDQTVRPERSLFSTASAETAHFEINGKISGPNHARLTIHSGRTSFSAPQQEPEELLIAEDAVYRREGGRWVRADEATPPLGIGHQGAVLVTAAREITYLEMETGPPGLGSLMADYRRIGFKLYPEDVRRQLLAQQGPLPQHAQPLAELQIPAIGGTGELWVRPDGTPDRIILNLGWTRGGEEPLHIAVTSETAYVSFGADLPAQHFNPERTPVDGAPLPELAYLDWLRPTLMVMVALGVIGFFWILNRARTGARRALQGVTILLIVALLIPYTTPVIDAAAAPQGRGQTESAADDRSNVQKLMSDLRTYQEENQLTIADQAGALDADGDEDGDTLPNGYELTLGTNPFSEDSDLDGLTDAQEVLGIECAGGKIFSDPLNPDSNHDGLRDGDEFWRGQCFKGDAIGWIWDDDNDKDGVPDDLDLSPFSNSMAEGALGGERWDFTATPGANLTFESLDMDADPNRTVIYPFYVEVQIRPTLTDSLRWAYKHLYWPHDPHGPIQNSDPLQAYIAEKQGKPFNGSSGKMTLMPFLSATVREDELPSPKAQQPYGVSANAQLDDEGNNRFDVDGVQLYDLNIPLMPVEQGGQIYAFQAKMLHDQYNSNLLTRSWKDLRLKWVIVGDLLMSDEDGQYIRSLNGGYGLVIYDESYHITGLQVTRQGGVSVLTAAARYEEGLPYDDAPITLLRAGAETRFLSGDLDLATLRNRFNAPSNASLEERWGIPLDQEFRVQLASYPHVDEALATTTMTNTRQLLRDEFQDIWQTGMNPTVMFATEQRTSVVNLDDDPTKSFKTVTLNTCLKPLITSRTLQLQTYKYEYFHPDDFIRTWMPLDLDETLALVEAHYAAQTDPNHPYFKEELSILQLAATAWFMGSTTIIKIGDYLLPSDYAGQPFKDADLVKFFLDKKVFLKTTTSAKLALLEVDDQPLDWLRKKTEKTVKVAKAGKDVVKAGFKVMQPDGSAALGITGFAFKILLVFGAILDLFGISELNKAVKHTTKSLKALKSLIEIGYIANRLGMLKGTPELASFTAKYTQGISALGVIGAIVTVAAIWITLFFQLSDLGSNVATALVMQAIIETILTVVLLIVSTLGPWGVLVVTMVGLLYLLEEWTGYTFSPVMLLVKWLFTPEVVERVDFAAPPNIGQMTMTQIQPDGGLLANRRFRISMPATTTLITKNDATKADLEEASADLRFGQFIGGAQGIAFCTTSNELFAEYQKKLQGFINSVSNPSEEGKPGCVNFTVPPSSIKFWPGEDLINNAPQKKGNQWTRAIESVDWIEAKPSEAINSRFFIDIWMRIKIPYDQCTKATGCDRRYAWISTAPTIVEYYLDILPESLEEFWAWDALHNPDPDGDGLTGYQISPNSWIGPDAKFCPGLIWNPATNWDTDGDGLSDKFELQTPGLDPCKSDTDGDGLSDYDELRMGTDPNNKDTDGDGLSDAQEVARRHGNTYVGPWVVKTNNDYPGLPNPYAFPNPRSANDDTDYLGDKMEMVKQSSPNAYNEIPAGQALSLYIGQSLQPGSLNGVTVGASPWQNNYTAAIEPTLTVTLPVSFANVVTDARVYPALAAPEANLATPLPTGNPNVYRWKLPMLSLGRSPSIQITGLPAIPSGPVSITAQLVYTEGSKLQIALAEVPLWFNEGGPRTEISGVTGGVIIDNGVAAAGAQASFFANSNTPVIVQGTAEDPERVDKVFVCLVASGPCAAGDWKEANGRNIWSYSFAAPADGVYTVRAYAIDSLGAVGAAEEASVGVDTSAPTAINLDLEGTVYLPTQVTAIASRADGAFVAEPPFVMLSGQVSDKDGGAFVSGVDKVGILVNGEQAYTVDVANPGATSSAFNFKWTLPNSYGSSVRDGQGIYEITVAAQDRAGNIGATDSVTVIIDDTPPTVHTALPQVSTATTFQLSGRADDTALVYNRQPTPTFAERLSTVDSPTQFTTGAGKAVIVGDVNGDTIDDVLLLVPSAGLTAQPLQAGIFFGKPGGLPASLTLTNADVKLQGEGPTGSVADGAAAGDVNGDGVGDLIVGDPGRGSAYLILGRRGGWPATINLGSADWKLTQTGSSGFGGSVAGAGDVDGDGLADLLVGASSQGSINGPVWLYLGREQGTPNAIRLFYMGRAGAGAPRLAGLGDATGDGLSDFVMAAQGVPAALVAGRAPNDWPAGNINLASLATMQFSGSNNGMTAAAAGDVNGDGLRDLLVGDPNAASPMLYLIYGRRNFAGSSTLAAAAAASFQPGTAPDSRLGAGMATLGDVDGDGRADFTFGQPGNGNGPNRAAVIMTRGNSLEPNMSVNAAAASLIVGTTASQRFGAYVSAGDVTGDGIADILVGAVGEGKAYLFAGAFDPGGVAGIKNVEIGFTGPNIDSATPTTATLPTNWQTATLGNSHSGISAWLGQLTVPGNGDYRIYVRTADKADNGRDDTTWYVGNVWVNTAPAAFNGSTATMETPLLTDKTDLALSGAINSSQTPQMVRVFDGYRWQRLQPATGNWALQSTIPLHDLYTDIFRVVARDAVGNPLHAARTLAVDTLVVAPTLSTTMPVNVWQTNSPSLTLNWPAIADGSGIATTWAVINTLSDDTPTTPAVGNQLVTPLNAAGSYYGHVRVQDNAGNEAITHIGPFLVNRTQTPSAILVDGMMDTVGGEYPAGMLLNYDPYALFKPAALWGTWDSSHLYLGYPGASWGTGNRLALYVDTKNGGLTQSLALFGKVHTLPFAADYAFIVGDDVETPFALYTVTGGAWAKVANAKSFAEINGATEIALNRAEIEATGAVGLLAYAEDADGVWAVLPGGARPDTEALLTGPVTFGEKLSWGSLGNGVLPGAGQQQVHAPVITVLPAVQTILAGGEGTTFQTLIHNPDVGTYANVPVSITVDAPMQLTGVSGATCSNCPAGGRTWEVLANVAAGGTQTVTVNAQMGGTDLTGLFPVGVSARMIGSGPALSPQLPATSNYLLDQGVAVVDFLFNSPVQYHQPGQVDFQLIPDLDLSSVARCQSLVEVNTGSGWQSICDQIDCTVTVGDLPVGGIKEWQIRTQGRNGQVSEIKKIQVIADSTPPTVEIADTAVISGNIGFIEGLTWDSFPPTVAPQRVEVSINNGLFFPVAVSQPKRTQQRNGVETETAVWRLPVDFDGVDGQQIVVVARSIDEAGNVGEPSRPMTLTIDSVAPTVAVTQTGDSLVGTVTDGAGVATVEVSLDGGKTYQPMTRRGDQVRFDLVRWRGERPQAMAMMRAVDLYGNVSVAVTPVSTKSFASRQIFLPSIQRGAETRDAIESASAAEPVEAAQDTATDAPVESSTGSWQLFLPAVNGNAMPASSAGDEWSADLPPAEEGTQN